RTPTPTGPTRPATAGRCRPLVGRAAPPCQADPPPSGRPPVPASLPRWRGGPGHADGAARTLTAVDGRRYDLTMSLVRSRSRRPRAIGATEFKARCPEAMDPGAPTGHPLVVTKRGKPARRP